MVTMTINLSDEINAKLSNIADGYGISKAEAIERAFALLSIEASTKKKGESLGIVKLNNENNGLEVVSTIAGIRHEW
jgi:metal-responsive CopG/Arc/MetJ family transcriptional regulator